MDDEAVPPPQPGPLWDSWSRLAYQIAWRILHDRDDCDEVVQEVLAALWKTEPKPDNPEGWITVVMPRKVADLLEARARELRRIRRSQRLRAMPPQIAPDIAEQVVRSLDTDRLLAELTAREREVVDLTLLQDLSRREAAARLGLGEESVKTLHSRSVGKLRRSFLDKGSES